MLFLSVPAARAGDQDAMKAAEQLRSSVLSDLVSRFDRLLADEKDYTRKVRRECKGFPEGDLFPFTFPVLAYAALISRGGAADPGRIESMVWLLEQARQAVLKRVKPPDNNLMKLDSYGGEAVYLCQYHLALSAFRVATGDKRFDEVLHHVAEVLLGALKKTRGQPLESFPGIVYPFDTLPCLASMNLYAKATSNSDLRPYIEEHLHWIIARGMDKKTGLPASKVDRKTYARLAPPRGCDLSYRVALTAGIQRSEAIRVYKPYVKHFWKELLVAAGFAEWPDDRQGKADSDSGPIIMGLGMAASGFGLAATRLMGDGPRFLRLMKQLVDVRRMVQTLQSPERGGKPALLGNSIAVRPGYYTGFLFGDCALFFALAWSDKLVP